MFVTIYYPIFDMRGFLPSRESRTKRPTWPIPDLSGTPFQRNLGAIRHRPLGAVRGWAAESSICEIGRSVSLVPQCWEPERSPIRASFKRFYADGEGGAQFSLGIPVPLGHSRSRREQGHALAVILDARLRSRHWAENVPVRNAGPSVANLFAGGTTKGNRFAHPVLHIEHGRPLILMQGLRRQGRANSIDLNVSAAAAGNRWALYDLSRSFELALPGPVLMLDAAVSDRTIARSTRIILARLYLELFCFERCVALLTSPVMELLDERGKAQLLSRIALSAGRLSGPRAPGITQGTDLYGQLSSAFAKVHRPGRIDELETALRIAGASLNLQRAVVTAAEQTDVISTAAWGGIQVTYKTYINLGQAAAFGDNAQASNFTQAWAAHGGEIDLTALATDLGRLQSALQAEAKTGEQMVSVAAITQAKEAAEAGDGVGMLGHLARGGKWALSMAEKIGAALAAAVIKGQLGL